MHIPSYQMHNVLNVYSKQLSQNRIGGNSKNLFQKSLTDQINLSPEGKRKATIERVAKEILDKITHLGKQNTEDQVALETSDQVQNNQGKTEKTNQFIFNVIDDLNKKKQTSLSVEDTNFLVNRLEQLVKEAVENEGGNGSSNSSNEKA
ncbi:MAG: hypothetical protein PVF79_20005 [Desulfobacterales bacterium]|jgi:hypothetical protein